MNPLTPRKLGAVLLLSSSASFSADTFFSGGQILFERERGNAENPGGSVGPSPGFSAGSGAFIPHDPATYLLNGLSVDNNSGAGYSGTNAVNGGTTVNQSGNNFDLFYTFQFYDADGEFSFTEDYDDQVFVDVTPIVGPTDGTTTGATQSHGDNRWDRPTFGNFDFGGGGWFTADVQFIEGGGGAGLHGQGIGFGFLNSTASTTLGGNINPMDGVAGNPLPASGPPTGGSYYFPSTDTASTQFGGIGYVPANQPGGGGFQAVFDTDPISGESWGVAIVIPEPSRALLLAVALCAVGLQRRR